MIELTEIQASRFRFVIGSMVIIASLILLYFMTTAFINNEVVFALESPDTETTSGDRLEDKYFSPNPVSVGLARMADSTVNVIESVEQSIASKTNTVATATVTASKSLASSTFQASKYIARGTYKGLAFAATGLGNGIVFVVQVPSKVIGFTANLLSSNSLVRPTDNTEVPVIDTQLDAIYANQPTVTPEELASQAAIQTSANSSWPINGRITTKFGVPHWP
jgi:hypothetical protein